LFDLSIFREANRKIKSLRLLQIVSFKSSIVKQSGFGFRKHNQRLWGVAS